MNNVNTSIFIAINQISVLIMLVQLILLEYNSCEYYILYSSDCWHVYYISYSNVTYLIIYCNNINIS